MGILGIGGIGSAIAKRARSFGMTVYGIDLNDSLLPEGVQEVWRPERLSELMAVSDWFVVAVPFTKQTENLIDDTQLDYLKKGNSSKSETERLKQIRSLLPTQFNYISSDYHNKEQNRYQ